MRRGVIAVCQPTAEIVFVCLFFGAAKENIFCIYVPPACLTMWNMKQHLCDLLNVFAAEVGGLKNHENNI
jgi:hypothetical protein